MDKLEIKLKECCLTCDHFYLDTGKIGIMGCCTSAPRELSCLHMPVCGTYQAADTLASKSGGGGEFLETLEPQWIRGVALFLSDGKVAVIPCGENPPSPSGTPPFAKGGNADD